MSVTSKGLISSSRPILNDLQVERPPHVCLRSRFVTLNGVSAEACWPSPAVNMSSHHVFDFPILVHVMLATYAMYDAVRYGIEEPRWTW